MSINIAELLMESTVQTEINGYWVPAKELNWTENRTFRQKIKDCIEVWTGKSVAVNWDGADTLKSTGMTFYG